MYSLDSQCVQERLAKAVFVNAFGANHQRVKESTAWVSTLTELAVKQKKGDELLKWGV